MFLDPLEELYRKPDPTMADGQNLTSMYGRFPQELLGCQIEDIDFYYRSKKVRAFSWYTHARFRKLNQLNISEEQKAHKKYTADLFFDEK